MLAATWGLTVLLRQAHDVGLCAAGVRGWRKALRATVERYRQRHPERGLPPPPEEKPMPKPAAAHP